MFAKIRNHLTMVYAAVMVCFLLSFVAASYTGLVWVLYREEQQDVQAFAQEEAHEHINLLRQKQLFGNMPFEEDEQNTGKLFHYVFDAQGELVSSSEPSRELNNAILEHIQQWDKSDGEAVLTKLHFTGERKNYFMLCSVNIYEEDQLLGTVFVGKDITSYYVMLKRLLLVLCLACLLFLGIATFAGHVLAGRAIIPIKHSFARQREFVADASHELRTPLSVMLASTDAIQTDDESTLSPFAEQVLDDMKSEIKRMTKIVSDLLTLARADAGAASIIKEAVDINMIAEKVVCSLQPLAADKGIVLEFLGTGRLIIQADKARIRQLLLILLDNALKFVRTEGNVSLAISQQTGLKGNISITVQDNGIGIPAQDQKLIFERFYRIDKARSREAGGTGLGLSIAKWIVEAHGGTIRVESADGNGSRFIVILPV